MRFELGVALEEMEGSGRVWEGKSRRCHVGRAVHGPTETRVGAIYIPQRDA